jgi:hypothetical protein
MAGGVVAWVECLEEDRVGVCDMKGVNLSSAHPDAAEYRA